MKIIKVILMIFFITIVSYDTNRLLININIDGMRRIYDNNEIVGRLEIPYLFNVYIVKGVDNSFYLNHGIDKRKDIRGVPFIDYRSNVNGNQINIYGHNSKQFDLPFKQLERYLDYEFFINNNIIILELMGEYRFYKIFMIKEITTDIEHMLIFYNEEFIEHIDRLMKDTIYKININYNKYSQILILQTCNIDKESYYVIGAIRI